MTISIIIPTLNEQENIGNLLNDLKNQTSQPLEVIVVDANSRDQTVLLAQDLGAKVITTNPGVGAQRTLGGKSAIADTLIFFDADSRVLDKSFLENLTKSMQQNNLEITCPIYLPYESTLTIKIIFGFYNLMFWLFQKIAPAGAGPCIAVKKSLFEKVGGFENQYTYDDIHFVRKAGKRGKFALTPLTMHTSDRRFKKQGTLYVGIQYLFLSFFFIIGRFDWANKINYKFDIYKN